MAHIKIGTLGGLEENGKNMAIVEVDEHIFILDAGLKYPDVDMYGVDAVVPDMDYLVQNKERIMGVFISHGHEDHIGALPYLLEKINVPVFGTHFTICLIEDLLTESNMNIKKYKLYRINDNKVLEFDNKNITVTFFNTTHSIPESVGIAINTIDGSIVYLTDFTFNFSSGLKYQTSFDKITDLGKNGVLIVMPESIGSGTLGRVSNDKLLEYAYSKLLNRKGRIIVSAFSSDLSRIQKIIDMSVTNNKKIAIIGRRAQRIINIAINSGYLEIPEGHLVNLKFIDENNDNNDPNLVVIVTGVRQEPYSVLMRMASGQDRLIKLNQDDTVVLMSPPVPGTENFATETLNTLYKYDIDVSVFTKEVLKSTHASSDDLKLLYSMLKPKYIIPIKGEVRHLIQQKDIAMEYGYKKEQIFVLENGLFVNFVDKEFTEKNKIHLNDIFIDGQISDIDTKIIKERENLAEEGVVIVSALIDLANKQLKSEVSIYKKGFVSVNSDERLISTESRVIDSAIGIINNYLTKKKFDLEAVKTAICEETAKIIFRFDRKRPIVIADINILLPKAEFVPLIEHQKNNTNSNQVVSKNKKTPTIIENNQDKKNKNNQKIQPKKAIKTQKNSSEQINKSNNFKKNYHKNSQNNLNENNK